jgi:hypothetical protein
MIHLKRSTEEPGRNISATYVYVGEETAEGTILWKVQTGYYPPSGDTGRESNSWKDDPAKFVCDNAPAWRIFELVKEGVIEKPYVHLGYGNHALAGTDPSTLEFHIPEARVRLEEFFKLMT